MLAPLFCCSTIEVRYLMFLVQSTSMDYIRAVIFTVNYVSSSSFVVRPSQAMSTTDFSFLLIDRGRWVRRWLVKPVCARNSLPHVEPVMDVLATFPFSGGTFFMRLNNTLLLNCGGFGWDVAPSHSTGRTISLASQWFIIFMLHFYHNT